MDTKQRYKGTALYLARGRGRQRGQSFDVNRNILSLDSFVASFKKISLHFFNDLIHVYSPRAGVNRP